MLALFITADTTFVPVMMINPRNSLQKNEFNFQNIVLNQSFEHVFRMLFKVVDFGCYGESLPANFAEQNIFISTCVSSREIFD